MPEPEFLTLSQTAALLQMSYITILRCVKRGELPGAVKIGKSWRVSRAVLIAAFHEPRTELDEAFWQMIEERRQQTATISHEALEAELLGSS